jgi:spermidine/putrescine transport system ATP-binding protein
MSRTTAERAQPEVDVILNGLRKEFGDLVAVQDVSFSIRDGEIICLLGPSGCGKSTTLRMIAGLEQPTAGSVSFDTQDVTNTAPYDRDCAMVFQSWALFPHKTTLENVAFGLKMAGIGKTGRQQQARELLNQVQLAEYEDAYPSELSGGQKQRVALARALAIEPHVLLLDEPLSNLDKKLREEMQIQLKDIHDQFGQTMLYVTHDQNEAFTLADRIGIMDDGELVQIGPPQEVYNSPRNRFIESFLGDTNFVSGTITASNEGSQTVDVGLDTPLTIPAPRTDVTVKPGDTVEISIRPEIVSFTTGEQGTIHDDKTTQHTDKKEDRQAITGEVSNVLYRGSTIRYYVALGDKEVFVEKNVTDVERADRGESVTLEWPSEGLHVFNEEGRRVV